MKCKHENKQRYQSFWCCLDCGTTSKSPQFNCLEWYEREWVPNYVKGAVEFKQSAGAVKWYKESDK